MYTALSARDLAVWSTSGEFRRSNQGERRLHEDIYSIEHLSIATRGSRTTRSVVYALIDCDQRIAAKDSCCY
jgi:hypothetical protein